MNRYRKALYATIAVVVALLVAFCGVAAVVYSATGRISTKGARYPEPRIGELVWPTIGYPALVTPGRTVELELDLASGSTAGTPQPRRVREWGASIKPTRKELSGLDYTLRVTGAHLGATGRWPRGSRGGRSREVWHLTAEVPQGAMPELYDLTVYANVAGRAVLDHQPHSVAVMEDDDDSFTFVTLADIHVHRRGVSTVYEELTDKGIGPGGRPVYLEKAIEQVNLIRPDFVIILGDNIRAQHGPGDYQYEFKRFMSALGRLEVPAFLLPGNHDQYVNEVDGSRVWEENIGPLYYSFDIGGCHVVALNTYEWPWEDRVVMRKFGMFTYPRKWQGRVQEQEEGAAYPAEGHQLNWLKNELAYQQDSKLRFVALHHDPFTPGGRGEAYDSELFAGVFYLGGGGEGRGALKEVAARYKVDMVLGGHLHSDHVGRAPWRRRRGWTIYASQTAVSFDQGGKQDHYPGYRLVRVEDGRLAGFGYIDETSSMPFYDGSVPRGTTDIDRLDVPALSAVATRSMGAITWNGWAVTSFLGVPVRLRGLIRVVDWKARAGPIENGTIYRSVDIPGGRSLVYVESEIPEGTPSTNSAKRGVPSKLVVKVRMPTSR